MTNIEKQYIQPYQSNLYTKSPHAKVYKQEQSNQKDNRISTINTQYTVVYDQQPQFVQSQIQSQPQSFVVQQPQQMMQTTQKIIMQQPHQVLQTQKILLQQQQPQPIIVQQQQQPILVQQPQPIIVQQQQQPIIVQQQQQQPRRQTVQEVHHYETPIQVVTMEDIESKWKTKCVLLEQAVYDLQVQLQRYKNTQVQVMPEIQYVQDDSKDQRIRLLVETESTLRRENSIQKEELNDWMNRFRQLENLYSASQGGEEIQRQLKSEIKQLKSEIENLRRELRNRDEDLNRFKGLIDEKDYEINSLRDQLDTMNQKMDTYESTQQTISYLTSDIDIWKKKFRDSNQELADCREQWALAQAELDALKNRKVQVQVEEHRSVTTVNRQSAQRTAVQSQFGQQPNIHVSGVQDRSTRESQVQQKIHDLTGQSPYQRGEDSSYYGQRRQ